jgi:hypothetical protein
VVETCAEAKVLAMGFTGMPPMDLQSVDLKASLLAWRVSGRGAFCELPDWRDSHF